MNHLVKAAAEKLTNLQNERDQLRAELAEAKKVIHSLHESDSADTDLLADCLAARAFMEKYKMNTCNQCTAEIPKKRRYCDKCRDEKRLLRYTPKTDRKRGAVSATAAGLIKGKKKISPSDLEPTLTRVQSRHVLRLLTRHGKLKLIKKGFAFWGISAEPVYELIA
jgi:hypothetical protein